MAAIPEVVGAIHRTGADDRYETTVALGELPNELLLHELHLRGTRRGRDGSCSSGDVSSMREPAGICEYP